MWYPLCLALAVVVGSVAAHREDGPLGPRSEEYEKQFHARAYKMRMEMVETLSDTEALLNLSKARAKANSRCTSGKTISCTYRDVQISGRWVGYQEPLGTAPRDGWPFVVLYHGWNLMNSEFAWYAEDWYSYGLYHKASLIKHLLDEGYGVITPDAHNSLNYWDTNEREYATADLNAWSKSRDHAVVEGILDACSRGTFGPCNDKKLHAVGFSSGGYMSSRMAVNYGSRFRSISIMAGAYYYCAGSCTDSVANQLSSSVWASHPPTLFLHGRRDSMVPESTSQLYYNKLRSHGVETSRKTVNVDHQWSSDAPAEMLSWIQKHN